MKTNYSFFFSFFVLLLLNQLPNPNAIDGKDKDINWITLSELSTKKMTFVYIYKEGEGASNRMYNTVFNNPEIIKYGNKKFNFVKLNAETQLDEINHLGISLQEFPTTVILNKDEIILQDIRGFITLGDFSAMMNYYGEESYKNNTWKEFQKKFKEKNKDTAPMYDGV